MKYRPEIDGLRSIAVLPVLFFHAGFSLFSGGFVGVDIFFVISGYLITSIILNERIAQTFTITNFYERRARRILPALFTIILFCIPLALSLMTPGELKDFALSIIATSMFSSNILFWQEAGYFAGPNELKPLLHTWSLAVEEQYYLLFPLFLALTWKLGFKWILGLLIIAASSSLILSQLATSNFPVANFYLLPTRGWELLIGVFVAFYLVTKNNESSLLPHWLSELAALLGVFLIGYAVLVFDSLTPFPGLWALIPCIGTALIILFATPKTFVGRFLSLKIIVGVGLISYSLYLWHQPLFAFARIYSQEDLTTNAYFFLIFLSFLFAYISWRYVEKIFREKNRISANCIFVGSGMISLLLVLLGGLIYFKTPLFVNGEIYSRSTQIENLKIGRLDNIQSGICHFNGLGKFKTFDEFLHNWSCLEGDEKELTTLNIGVFGDSHSSDVSMSLRLNGIDFIQLAGANCELMAEARPQPIYCNRIREKFEQTLKDRGVTSVLLANNFNYEELNAQNLSKIFDYWSTSYANVFIMSPMPEAIELHREFLTFGSVTKPFSLEKNKIFYDLISTVKIPSNIIILDSRIFLCSQASEHCFFKDSELRMVDETHLSIIGAMKFGELLLESNSIKALIENQQMLRNE